MANANPVKRQIAMVLDLNKCIGCQTCTIACKKLWNKDTGTGYAYWNNVETLPGRGYPRDWFDHGSRAADGTVRRGTLDGVDQGYGREEEGLVPERRQGMLQQATPPPRPSPSSRERRPRGTRGTSHP